MAGLTTLIICLDTGADADADQAFGYAVARTTETSLGIVAGFMIFLVVFPRSIAPTLTANLAAAWNKVVELACQAGDLNSELSPEATRAVGQSLVAAYANLRALALERLVRPGALGRLRAEAGRLNRVFAASEALSFALDTCPGDPGLPPDVAHARHSLASLLAALPADATDAQVSAEHAARFRSFADRTAQALDLDDDPSADRLAAVSALYRLHVFAEDMAAFLDAEAAVLDPDRPLVVVAHAQTRYLDVRAAIELGLRPALVFACGSAFWIASAWSMGKTLAMLTGALTLLIPSLSPRAALGTAGALLGLGFIAMAPVALLLMAVLPWMQSFFGFAVLISSVVFTFFFVCHTRQTFSIALGGVVLLSVGLQPANIESYAPATLINLVAALLILPIAFTLSMTIFFPNTRARIRRHLHRGTDELLEKATRSVISTQGFFSQNTDLFADYGGDLDLADEVNRHLVQRNRSATMVGIELFAIREQCALVLLNGDRRVAAALLGANRKRRTDEPDVELATLEQIQAESLEVVREDSQERKPRAFRLLMANELIRTMIHHRRLAAP